MGQDRPEVADVLRRHLDAYEARYGRLRPLEQRVVRDLLACRTAQLGGHLYVCDHCGVVTERYNSGSPQLRVGRGG